MPHNGTQSDFAHALLAQREVPADLRLVGEGAALARRFGVYRNTVFSSLINVLAARFPVVAQLAGLDFFRGMAATFIAERPPASPVLLMYGGDFSEFIAMFGPAREIPYLADVARFEWTLHAVSHAADADPIDPAVFVAAAASESWSEVRLILHPAARHFRSAYPVVSLWRAHMDAVAAQHDFSGAEAALITRPDLSVYVYDLTPGAYAFVLALSQSATLGVALATAQAVQPDFDLAATLALMFRAGAIAGFSQI